MDSSRVGALTILACMAFAGCSSTPVATVSATPAQAATVSPSSDRPSTGSAQSVAQSSVATVTAPYLDPSNPLSRERSVYFGFDDFTVGKDYTPLIERHAGYLSSAPAVSIKVEGNADERGSAEYNLALGQRRAEAVVKALETFGAKGGQLEPISWGKEHPKAAGHDETAWAENRRADLVYPSR